MRRREFLRMTGAAAAFGGALPPMAPGATATVLYDDHTTLLGSTLSDPKNAKDELWVRKTDLSRINGFELKPQGACRADVCIPIKKDMTRGDYFDLTSFARLVGQAVVTDASAGVWS